MFQGVHAALVTPRRSNSTEVDIAAALELIDFACSAGLDGLVLLGTTGEFIHYDLAERARFIRLATKRSRIPVTVNVSHSTLEGAITLAREAASSGASGLLLMPPYFFEYPQEVLESFFLAFAREAGIPLPILIYNMPAVTSPISFETLMRLISTGSFSGVKDSSGRMDDFRRMKALKNQFRFSILIGDDRIFADARSEGADGLISGVASALPELLVALDRSISAGAFEKEKRLEARLHEFIAWTSRFPFPVALREAIRLRGIDPGPPAAPLDPESARRLEEFRDWFRQWLPTLMEEIRA